MCIVVVSFFVQIKVSPYKYVSHIIAINVSASFITWYVSFGAISKGDPLLQDITNTVITFAHKFKHAKKK